ncbi:MAG: YcgL domain-containing protein [Pasteurellaceae bacterium]|nr:YcgL domain-containing protein [Pasteurellaceae bacterium]
MLCAIYKSTKKERMYLYVSQRDNFSAVPESLMQAFGKLHLVMLFNLAGKKTLKGLNHQDVIDALQTQGFYLQILEKEPNLLQQYLQDKPKH